MRVLYFYRNDNVHDRRFLEALGKLPLEVAALPLENRTPREEEWQVPANVRRFTRQFRRIRSFRLWEPVLIHDLKRIVGIINPDIIHAGPLDLCGYLAARSSGRPLVGMSWGFDLLVNAKRSLRSRKRIQYALARSSILLSDCETVCSAAEAFSFPRERMITFPWGVDLKAFRPEPGSSLRKTLGWEKNVVLLSMRSMEELYGVDVIVKAFIPAAGKMRSLALLLLGDGSQKPHLMHEIALAGLNDRVRFVGAVPEAEVSDYIHASDVYISASHSDGSSVSLLQAMACGKPALVSDIPGNREWVLPGRNGWIFADGDTSTLEHLMILAATGEGSRNKFGQAARKTVEKHADWAQNSSKLMVAYCMARENNWRRD